MKNTDNTALLFSGLQELVTSETRLAILTREAHWNVTGQAFYSLHEMFGTQYTAIDGFVDNIAERLRQTGQLVSGSPAMTVSEIQSDADTILRELVTKHAHITLKLTDTIRVAQSNNDEGTADLLTGILQEHDKMKWMLASSVSRAY